MWPGEQPPGGAQNPQQHPGSGTGQNPYQQPGYQQPNPYQQSPSWNVPTRPEGTPASPPGGAGPTGGGNRTKVVAIVAAAAVVVAAGVTGLLLLGGGKDDKVDPGPTKSPSPQPSSSESGGSRGSGADKATIAGWKVVVNPAVGIAFDVPAQWAPSESGWVSYVAENDDPDDKPLIAMRAPAYLKEKWCGSDTDRDGSTDYTPLAAAGSRGNNGAKSTERIAGADPRTWVYGAYTQPDKTKVTSGPVTSYTTKSGITGSLGTAWSAGVKKSKKCATDGKATTFAFQNAAGDFVSWSFYGAKGVTDEVPDATVRRILGTVRLVKDPSDS